MDALKLLFGIISLAAAIFGWWVKNDAEKKKRVAERKQEIKDAVYSGDIAGLHSVIDGLRR